MKQENQIVLIKMAELQKAKRSLEDSFNILTHCVNWVETEEGKRLKQEIYKLCHERDRSVIQEKFTTGKAEKLIHDIFEIAEDLKIYSRCLSREKYDEVWDYSIRDRADDVKRIIRIKELWRHIEE